MEDFVSPLLGKGLKYNPYRPKQVMDGDVLVGTIERETTSKGCYATLEATGEQMWHPSVGAARQWLMDQRGEMRHQDSVEMRFSLRHQWDYVD